MLTKKLFTILLICLSLSAQNAFARKVSLKKIGGNNTLFVPTGYTLANLPNAMITTDLIVWDDDLSSGNPLILNWTDIFVDVSYIINNDPQNSSINVEYKILIDAPQSNPIMVGKQNTLTSTKFAEGKNIIDLESPTNRINKVTVSTLNSKAYVKYEPNLYFGSWLKNGQSFTFYTFEHDDDENFTTPGTTIINSTEYPSTSTFYKLAFVINGTSGITPTPYTNSTGSEEAVSAIQGTPSGSVWREVYGEALQANIGFFFAATNCNNITVEKLDVDGNNVNARLGGVWGDAGIQLVHTGIYYGNCEYSNIKDVNIHNMCLDGAYVRGNLTNNITIDNSFFEFNVRQGLSWLEGTNLMANYCSFSNTGRAISIASGINISSPPASGLDIEPGAGYEVHNGTFNHCNFDNNVGNCVANDGAELTTFDMTFNHCTFSDIDGYGLWCTGNNFTFDDCDINCPVVYGYNGSASNGYHKYLNCRFEDKRYDGQPMQMRLFAIDGVGAKQLFKGCRFTLNETNNEFGKMNFSSGNGITDWAVMESDTFIYNNDGAPASNQYTIINNVRFRGHNVIKNMNNSVGSYHQIGTAAASFEGNNDCNPYTFDVEGQVIFLAFRNDIFFKMGTNTDATLTDKYFKFKIKNKGLLWVKDDGEITIGSNSKVVSQEGGSFSILYPGQQPTINLEGGIIAEKGGYFFGGNSIVQGIGSKQFIYFDKDANTAGKLANPFWTSVSASINVLPSASVLNNYTLGVNNVPCIQGGHTGMSSIACPSPSPIFNNIFTNGAINVMYNLTPDLTGPQFNFMFKPVGGTTPYTCTFDGILATPNTNILISAGVHLLLVTDANGCTSDFYFNTDGTLVIGCQSRIPSNEEPSPISNLTASQLVVFNNTSAFYYKNFYIEGHFTVDQNITFNHCHFYLTPGSRIDLSGSSQLTMFHCKLSAACDGMWDGIYADDINEQLDFDGCYINDMLNGVELIANAKGSLQNNKFANNHENIKIYGNTNATNCTITNNSFKQTSVLLPPYMSEKPLHGIYIYNSSDVMIGDNLTYDGNHFENLQNGITTNISNWHTGQFPFLQIHVYPYAKIQLFNNTFKNIKDGAGIDERGTAIYATREDPFNVLQVDVKNIQTVGANAYQTFEDCDFAIWHNRASGKISNQKIKDCVVGMLATEADGQKINIQNNLLEDVYWGILKAGDEANNGFNVTGNTITLPEGDESFPPMAIYSLYSSNNHVGNSYIVNNTVNMPKGNTGIGITIYKGLNDAVANNQIHFTTPNMDLNPGVPKMIGIYANESQGINVGGNTIDNGSSSNYIKTNNTGLYLIDSKESRLACNSMNFTKYGILAVGTNGSLSHYDKTIGNYMNNSDANLLLWKLTQEGTLGQVGKRITISPPTAYDANNDFVKPNNGILNHVFRITDCPGTSNDEIVTTAIKLDQTKSSVVSGNILDCKVTVTNPSTFTETYTCAGGDPNNGVLSPTYPMDVEYADLVAENDITYSEYADGARRMDEEMVMNWLENNASARANNTVLNAYYLALYADIVGLVNDVDRQISLLNDSTLRSNSAGWMTAYNQANDANNALVGTEVFEQNAKAMNTLYLSTLLHGSKFISEEDAENIEALAFTCPYVGGNAVFRARVLYSMNHFGVHYDDLEICNGQGIYKGGTSKLQEQLNQLVNYTPSTLGNARIVKEDEVYIYPNPTTNYINIGCKNAKQIIVYDLLGNTILRKELDKNIVENNLDVSLLHTGVYIYKIFKLDNSIYNGKLIIE